MNPYIYRFTFEIVDYDDYFDKEQSNRIYEDIKKHIEYAFGVNDDDCVLTQATMKVGVLCSKKQ